MIKELENLLYEKRLQDLFSPSGRERSKGTSLQLTVVER